MSKKVPESVLQKSLDRLSDMAKSQLFHSPSDSAPPSWAGSSFGDVDSMDDEIEPNGLDYNGVRSHLGEKVSKGYELSNAELAIVKGGDPIPHIVNKIEKGLSLTPAEQWVVDMVKSQSDESNDEEKPREAMGPGEKVDASNAPEHLSAAKDEEDEYEEEAEDKDGHDGDDDYKKSLDSAVNASTIMKSGIEMSPFLYELVNALDASLKGVEARLTKSLQKSLGNFADVLDARDSAQGEFFKSLAESVVGIGELTKSLSDGGSAPVAARAPKSAGVGGALSKSIGGIVADTNSLQKSQILDVMVDMVKSNQMSQTDVVQYEMSGHLPANVQAAVSAYLNGKR